MTDLIGELRARRLVRELDPIRRPGAGRPTRPIALDGEPWCVLGVSLDVDSVNFVAATVGGRELWQESVATNLRGVGIEDAYAAFEVLLRAQLVKLDLPHGPPHVSVGGPQGLHHPAPQGRTLVALEVGVPGYVDRDRGTVSWAPGLGWRDFELHDRISDTLDTAGITMAHVGVTNECQLAALHATRVELDLPSECIAAYLGGLRGLGTGLIVGGEIFRGAQGGAGEFGHRSVATAGPPCWCGRRGCLETSVGPQNLLAQAELLTAAEASQLVDEQPYKAIGFIAEAAAAGEPTVLRALARAGADIGDAVDDMIGAVNPHAVVLGGYLGVLSPYLMASLTDRIGERLAISAYAGTDVVALEQSIPRTVAGAVIAARDACLYDSLSLTKAVA